MENRVNLCCLNRAYPSLVEDKGRDSLLSAQIVDSRRPRVSAYNRELMPATVWLAPVALNEKVFKVIPQEL